MVRLVSISSERNIQISKEKELAVTEFKIHLTCKSNLLAAFRDAQSLLGS
jgi:hypothetical protein